MDNETNDKLNATLGKMGVMEPAHSSGSASTVKQSSDKGFYLIMAAMVVGMGFYVSYDMDKRYGANTTVSNEVKPTQADTKIVPVVVGDIPIVVATETPSETSAKATTDAAVDKQESVAAEKPVETDKQQPAATVVVDTAPVKKTAAPEAAQSSASVPVIETVTPAESETATSAPTEDTAAAAADVVAAPVVEPTPESVTEAVADSNDTPTLAPTAPATTAATMENNASGQEPSAYYPYGYNYGRPYQGGYYQQPYGYDRSYYYQYRNPYGYGYPYQQPATPPAE